MSSVGTANGTRLCRLLGMSGNPLGEVFSLPWARGEHQKCAAAAILLQLHPLLRLVKQRVALDRRDPARTVAGIAEFRAALKPARHATAARANWALIIGRFDATGHTRNIV
jgi:hypothetical protein